MNTFFKSTALVLAAAFPAAFCVESLGLTLPSAFNTAHMFGAFVIALTLLTMSTEYRTRKPLRVLASVGATPRSNLRLAA